MSGTFPPEGRARLAMPQMPEARVRRETPGQGDSLARIQTAVLPPVNHWGRVTRGAAARLPAAGGQASSGIVQAARGPSPQMNLPAALMMNSVSVTTPCTGMLNNVVAQILAEAVSLLFSLIFQEMVLISPTPPTAWTLT